MHRVGSRRLVEPDSNLSQGGRKCHSWRWLAIGLKISQFSSSIISDLAYRLIDYPRQVIVLCISNSSARLKNQNFNKRGWQSDTTTVDHEPSISTLGDSPQNENSPTVILGKVPVNIILSFSQRSFNLGLVRKLINKLLYPLAIRKVVFRMDFFYFWTDSMFSDRFICFWIKF